jgi:hypothetical protein
LEARRIFWYEYLNSEADERRQIQKEENTWSWWSCVEHPLLSLSLFSCGFLLGESKKTSLWSLYVKWMVEDGERGIFTNSFSQFKKHSRISVSVYIYI